MDLNSSVALVAKSILLVDDEESFSAAVAEALSGAEYTVRTASSGEAALAELARGHFDLVITDVMLPGIDGFELVQWLRKNRPEILVVMITAYGSVLLRRRSLHMGALRYIEKPFELTALTDFLEKMFNTPGFAGRVSDIDLLDYLQLIASTNKSKVIQITNGQEAGQLIVEGGQIIHAECADLVGLPAFYEIMSWKGGSFADVPFEMPDEPSVHENTSYLLMQAARSRDEQAWDEGEQAGEGEIAQKTGDGSCLEDEGEPAGSPTRSMAGPFNRHRKFLDSLANLHGVKGSVLVSREGLVLARGGDFPNGLEPLLYSFSEACEAVGSSLEFGGYDSATLTTADGDHIVIEHVGEYLIGVWLDTDQSPNEISPWIQEFSSALV